MQKVEPGDDPDHPFTYLDIASIDNTTYQVVAPKSYLGRDAPSRARQKVRRGNTMFSTVRTYLKNIAMVPNEFDGQVASTGFCVLNASDGIDPRFVFYNVVSDDFVSNLNTLQRGTSYPAVRDADVLAQRLALPPLPEQRRIVAEIEKQFTRLDASVATLRRTQANLKRYRASVLREACSGELVPTEAELARAEGRDYEQAGVLLERILAERRAHWDAQEKRRGKYKEPAAPDTSNLPMLPEGWVNSTMGQCFEVYVGATPRRNREDYWGGEIAWVSSSEVAFNRITATRETITAAGYDNASVNLHPKGTVLLGMIGEGKTRGQVAILDIPACNSQNSAALRIGSGNNQPALNKAKLLFWIFRRAIVKTQPR